MASNPQKTVYPSVPTKHWWELRRRFNQSVPSKVDEAYVAIQLGGMTPTSARANVLLPLKQLGLLDSEGKPTDLVYDWKSDERYADACASMRQSIYPESLTTAVPPSSATPEAAKRWFSDHARLGTEAAKKAAAMYLVLSEADPTKAPEPGRGASKKNTRNEKPTTNVAVKPAAPPAQISKEIEAQRQVEKADTAHKHRPSLHIDIQIHIDPSADATQIDAIFASMAKHLYGNEQGDG